MGHVASMEEKRYVRRVLVGKPKAVAEQKLLRKSRRVSLLHQTACAFCDTPVSICYKINPDH